MSGVQWFWVVLDIALLAINVWWAALTLGREGKLGAGWWNVAAAVWVVGCLCLKLYLTC